MVIRCAVLDGNGVEMMRNGVPMDVKYVLDDVGRFLVSCVYELLVDINSLPVYI